MEGIEMTIHIEAGKDWFLRSKAQGLDWGPFDTEEKAWSYLFGRDPVNNEVEQYQNCGWSVFRAFPDINEK